MSERYLGTAVGAVTRHWPRLLFAGVLDLIFGLIALVWPGVTVLALALVLGFLLLITGIATIGIGMRTRSPWLFVLGGISLLGAIICLIHPGAGVFAILLGCALWFLLTGFADLAVAFSGTGRRLYWSVLGVLSVVAGVIMLSSPGVAIATVALIAGIAFLIRGAAECAMAVQLRRAGQVVG